MPITALRTSSRYFAPGLTQVAWVPALSSPSVPTRAELAAGKDLSAEIAETSGWLIASDELDVPPDLGRRFASKLAGWRHVEESSITLYASEDGHDIRTLLAPLDEGYICWLDGGDVHNHPLHVFPVTVRSLGYLRGGDHAAMVQVQFSITSEPVETTVPTL